LPLVERGVHGIHKLHLQNGNSNSFAPLDVSPLSVAIVSASRIDSLDPGRKRGPEREKEQGTRERCGRTGREKKKEAKE